MSYPAPVGPPAGDPAMLLRYSRQDPAVVEEDFRTATFVLRPDDSPDRFRFAHTSMHEFFLAKALLRALRDGHDEDCSMARPSPETLDFLGQLLDCADPGDRHTALETLARLLSDYEAGATELAMAYWLVAVKKGLPEPSPGRVDLRGADLSEWEFRGRSAESLFPLAGARLTRARLLRTRFEFVDLSGADLSQVWAEGAEFRHSVASGLRLDKANLATTVWRHCTMHPLVDADRGNWYQAQVAHSEVDPDGLPKDFCGHATISHSRSPSGQPLQVPAVKSTEASLSVLLEHRAEVTACAWSGLGHRIVTGSRKGTLKVWDADTAQCLSTLVGHSDGVWACAWSSQGDRVVSASFDGTLRVWDAQSGQCLRTLVGHSDWVRACAWSGQGDRVVSGSDDGTLRVWDAESGQEVMTMVNGPGGEWAAVDLPGNRILAASAEAWRFLGWEWLDPATRQVRVLPAEHFGELPST